MKSRLPGFTGEVSLYVTGRRYWGGVALIAHGGAVVAAACTSHNDNLSPFHYCSDDPPGDCTINGGECIEYATKFGHFCKCVTKKTKLVEVGI